MKLSVIIPTYNEEEDIEKCLKSLFNQSEKDIEVIIVDDGSTDKTLEKIKKFLLKYKKKIKVLKQNHNGPGEARNFGAKNANGEILVFIDADMEFEKNYLKNLIKPLIEDVKKEIIGTTHDYEEATNIDNIWSNLWGKIRITSKDKDPRVYSGNVKIFRAIRKDKFLEMGGFDKKYGYADDQTFWFKYKIKPILAKNTICYHKNPETLKATFKQARWVGSSWKEKYKIFKIPIVNYFTIFIVFILFPLAVIYKTINTKREVSIEKRFKFYLYKFWGYFIGISRAVFLNKFSK